LSAALAGCNGEGGTTDYSNDNTYKDPLKNPAPVGCTVSYQAGNGTGISPKSELITKDNPIELPDAAGLEAPQEGAEFVGWNDGMLTYPAKYQYTVTKNVTFNARWAFTTLNDITTHLNTDNDVPVLIAVSGGAPKNSEDDTSLTWRNLLTAIKTAGQAGKLIELDLSGSTLALFNGTGEEKKFDYKDGAWGDAYKTGEKYIKKLVLPRAATSIDSNGIFKNGPFSSLEAVSGLNVSAIPDNAFSGLTTLAALAFPAAETIRQYAFQKCGSLTEVSLPAAETIEDNAFEYCTSLTSVSLPAAKTIGNVAFQYCTSLTSVSLPAAKTTKEYVFDHCSALTSVSLPEATKIGKYTFQYCTSLTSVSLPKATEIGESAFYYCTSLTDVSLPEATEIGQYAFYFCTKLTSVNLTKVESIGNYSTFSYCGSLTSVSLPKVENIAQYAFANCAKLTSVSLLAAKNINPNAFQNCYALTSISIAGGCGIDTDSQIRGGFKAYYDDSATDEHAEKAAGVYTYSSGTSSWSYEAL
jgi:hypothetical protein